jgi:hypothetical protein
MKNLIITAIFFLISLVSFSQTYTFDVKNYNLYVTNGFSEKDAIIKNNNQFVTKVSNKHYVLNVDKKIAFVTENGVKEKFKITDVIKKGNETEYQIESSVDGATTTFSIYLTFKNNNISNVCLLWYDPFNNLTFVKNVK